MNGLIVVKLPCQMKKQTQKCFKWQQNYWNLMDISNMRFPASQEKINKGDTLHYSYVLDTFNDRHPSQTLGQVKRTITGSAGLPGEIPASPVENRRFVIDFEDIPNLDATNEVAILPDLHLTSGEFSELVLIKLPLENEWRATFKFTPGTESVSVLTLSLKKNETPITETWSYVWYPEIP